MVFFELYDWPGEIAHVSELYVSEREQEATVELSNRHYETIEFVWVVHTPRLLAKDNSLHPAFASAVPHTKKL